MTTPTIKPFRLIIAGSRELNLSAPELAKVSRWLDHMTQNKPSLEVVSGCARGADKLGEAWAQDRGHQVVHFPAYWKAEGRSAGYKRNVRMASYANALIAIWDGKSKGTKHMIDIAIEKKLEHRVLNLTKVFSTTKEVA